MYFSLHVGNCFPQKKNNPYFSISSVSVNYIFPQNQKILIHHICLHPKGMVFFHKQKFIQLLDVILNKYTSFFQKRTDN
jgi:hypothetical protein